MKTFKPLEKGWRLFVAFSLLAWAFVIVTQIYFATRTEHILPSMMLLFWTYQIHDPSLFPDDYITNYISKLLNPVLYNYLQIAWAKVADPIILHRAMPIVVWLACIPFVYQAGYKLHGKFNAFITVGIYIISTTFIGRVVGGQSHGFSFLLLWAFLAAILHNKILYASILVVLSALLYPGVTPVMGITMAIWMLLPNIIPSPQRDYELLHKPLIHRLGILGITALVSAACIYPILNDHLDVEYGRVIPAFKEISAFPETGPEGHHKLYTFSFVLSLYALHFEGFAGLNGGSILCLIFIAFLVFGLLALDKNDNRTKLLRPFFLSFFLCHVVSMVVDIDNAYRYLIYPGPIYMTLMLPLILRRVCYRFLATPKALSTYLIALGCYTIISIFPSTLASGYYLHIDEKQRETLNFIRTLPKDAVFAGWPGDKYGRIIDYVPYFSNRTALVTQSTFVTTHEKYLLTMRARTYAFLDAYLANDPAPLIKLRDDFKVDYLIVNTDDFIGKTYPVYFEPYTSYIRGVWEDNKSRPFFALEYAKQHHIYKNGNFYIIDLHSINL